MPINAGEGSAGPVRDPIEPAKVLAVISNNILVLNNGQAKSFRRNQVVNISEFSSLPHKQREALTRVAPCKHIALEIEIVKTKSSETQG